MINDVVHMVGFNLSLDKEKRLDRSFVKCGQYRHCVYFIEIDGKVVYIGKCRDLWKRLDTYRNSKYWKIANPSNILKTCRIEMAIRKRKRVMLWVSEHDKNDYDDFEIQMIKRYNPEWNKMHVNSDQKPKNSL